MGCATIGNGGDMYLLKVGVLYIPPLEGGGYKSRVEKMTTMEEGVVQEGNLPPSLPPPLELGRKKSR